MPQDSEDNVLAMRGISKHFPGVQALDKVTFTVRRGEVHALVGENGAGKSTLMKILAGALPKDEGEILLNGRPEEVSSPLHAQRLGVSMIYQELNLVPGLSVAENLFLGREPVRGCTGLLDWGALRREAQQVLGRVALSVDVNEPVRRLSIAQRQMVEIAKALSQEASVIVMDEPSATLTERELERLFELIRNLRRQGVSIVYISHRLEEIFEIADRVTVLRDGRWVGTQGVTDVDRAAVIRMMVGRELEEHKAPVSGRRQQAVLSVRNLSRKGVLKDISFDLYAGEILGLTGLVGAGRTELARALFGADAVDSGSVILMGERVRIRSPGDAVQRGLGLVPEDRKQQGLVLNMALRENATLSALTTFCQLGFVRRGAERSAVAQLVSDLDIRTPGLDQIARNLSGGNQQKVVLSKWLLGECKVLLFDEPTRGVDVGAKAEIYRLMERLTGKGVAVLMISSDLPEVLQVSHRILVMCEGRIAGELSRAEATQESIMHLATGATS